ncbi:hypothetical protein Tco_0316078 [Tanacetum coccineum]
MHNNIMAAGSRDRPPMLATGRYAQWRSRFLRYIDTRPNGDALRKCILKGPYTPTIVTTPAVPATEDSPAVPVTFRIFSQMHNNIMAAGSRDRPPMLATGRYAQWRSRFLRYIDTRPNGDALRKCILKGPYTPTIVTTPAVPATEDSPAVPEQTTVETVTNMTPENRAHFESEKEAIHLILTGIGDEIYSTVDACQTAQEMWEAIERLQQGESLNIQDVKTNLFWEFGQFTSHDGETIESYYTRFYKMMNEMIRNNLTVATMQVNTLYYQTSKPHKSYAPTSKASLLTRSHATTRYKGKEIAKPITPPSESASEEDSDPEQAQKDKDHSRTSTLHYSIFHQRTGWKTVINSNCTLSETEYQLADCLLKHFPKKGFCISVRRIGIECLTPASYWSLIVLSALRRSGNENRQGMVKSYTICVYRRSTLCAGNPCQGDSLNQPDLDISLSRELVSKLSRGCKYAHVGQDTRSQDDVMHVKDQETYLQGTKYLKRTFSESRLMQLNELAELRDGAYENTRIYKERTKKWHDSRLRGDKDFKDLIEREIDELVEVSTSLEVLES